MDIESNRKARKWTRKELVGRLLWGFLGVPLFRFSPKPLWRWRSFLLRVFGAKVGQNVQIHPSIHVFIPWNLEVGEWSSIGFDALIYNLGPVTIGKNATISQRAHLCAGTHDYQDPALPLVKSKIDIGDDVWICADAFVGPNVRVGDGAVVGARAVVMRSVSSWKVVGGNPAVEIRARVLKDQS